MEWLTRATRVDARRRLGAKRHRLMAIAYAGFVLLPAVFLLMLGWNALQRDRLLVEQQVRDRLEYLADRAVYDLEAEVARWQRCLNTASRGPSGPTLDDPDVQRALQEQGGAALIRVAADGHTQGLPAHRLLYDVGDRMSVDNVTHAADNRFAAAEVAEFRDKNLSRAIQLYEALLRRAGPEDRPTLVHRLARTYRRQQRVDEAAQAYRTLAGYGDASIAGWPADLIARHQLCSLAAAAQPAAASEAVGLFRDLVEGRWRLTRFRYEAYAADARRWAEASDTSGVAIRPLLALEARKRELTDVVELATAPGGADPVWRSRSVVADGRLHLALWSNSTVRPAGAIGLVVGSRAIRTVFFPRAFAKVHDENLDVSVFLTSGGQVFGPDQASTARANTATVTRVPLLVDVPVRLVAWPRDPASFSRDFQQRQRIYVAALGLVACAVLFGGTLTVNAIRKELRVARLESDFAATVSHEFRTPLTGIRQLTEMLAEDRVHSHERRREYYDLILRSTGRLARLVDNVLDSASIEDGRKQYQMELLETTDWLRHAVDDFGRQLVGGSVSVVATIPERLPLLFGDTAALTLALHNLLDNAVKYSRGKPHVWVDARVDGEHVAIEVRDQGAGIEEGDRPHLFDRFYRGRGEATRHVKGTGLGLSLVRHAAAAHGGAVSFNSRVGEGTTFVLRLPVYREDPCPGGDGSHAGTGV